jgi:predicted nucleotidyltransferase
MVERAIDADILNTIQQYLRKISKVYTVDAVILFGSYANGTNGKDSDIDVAIVSSDFTDRYDDMARLMKLTWDVDTNIEPHPIRTDEFNARNNHFVEEIVRTGIQVA